MSDRLSPLRDVAKSLSLDAVALVPGANFQRIFGASFHQNERPLMVLIPVDGAPAAVVPNLEMGSFAAIGFEGEVFDWKDQTGYQAAFDAMFSQTPLERIGVEGQSMRVFVHHAMKKARASLEISDAQREIAALRLCKNESEIASLRKAIAVSETALAETIDLVKVGITEKEIESILIQKMFAAGADEFSFDPIVACGSNSARPHAHARHDVPIKPGDALLIDFGAKVEGLCADITRTFFIAHCDDRCQDIYNTVLDANLAGAAIVKPGVSAHEIDDTTTRVLENSSYADRIRHKTGHGLGRDIHEDPYIMRGNNEIMETGMVFTIEPGLYQLDDFGVRIEDDILVTSSGFESLTSFDKSLTIIA
ncbi:proline dipeptidase [Chromatiales bacterium (ex Bugula neritina AB1)]|nr:proline dipeptidase [Chromatiales bacterium (ex Bugula neritina AB1)]